MPEVVGVAEIAQQLKVSKNTVLNYAKRSGFPTPLEQLASGPVWRWADVEAWAKANLPLPTGRPPKPTP